MYDYKAKVIRVIDGDTVDAMIDLGFNTWVKKRIRLARIDAYESRTRNKNEKKKGLAAKARLKEILKEGGEFSLTSFGVGKYGRCIGEINLTTSLIRNNKYHGKSVNEAMVKEGHAKWLKT
jgi:micrococcal nuclease